MQRINLLLAVLFLLGANTSIAQITYTDASFERAGDIIQLTRATDSSLTISAPSATATTWDFSHFSPLNATLDTIKAASLGLNYSDFPTADILQPLVAGFGGTAYVDVTTGQMTRIGGGLELFGISFVNGYTNSHIVKTAPLTYSTLYSDNYNLSFAVNIDSVPMLRALVDSLAGSISGSADSIRISLEGTEVRTIDAWGSCMMPDSTYNVLRQKVLNIITMKIEIRVRAGFLPPRWIDMSPYVASALPVPLPNNDSTIYYDYLVEGLRQPLVRLQMDPTMNFIANIQYFTNDTTVRTIGVDYIAEQLEATIFPNPAADVINIAVAELPIDGYRLQLVDMTARVVLQQNNIQTNSYQLTTQTLPNGHYIVVLRNTKGKIIKREKISILR